MIDRSHAFALKKAAIISRAIKGLFVRQEFRERAVIKGGSFLASGSRTGGERGAQNSEGGAHTPAKTHQSLAEKILIILTLYFISLYSGERGCVRERGAAPPRRTPPQKRWRHSSINMLPYITIINGRELIIFLLKIYASAFRRCLRRLRFVSVQLFFQPWLITQVLYRLILFIFRLFNL